MACAACHETGCCSDAARGQFLAKLQAKASPAAFSSWVGVLAKHQSHSIDTAAVVAQAKELFGGERALLLGMNKYLPPKLRVRWAPLHRRQGGWAVYLTRPWPAPVPLTSV